VTSEGLMAKNEIMQKWHDVMEDVTKQMIEQAHQQGVRPEWLYPKKIITTDTEIRIHWGLRPDVEAALTVFMEGGSAEQAAKVGAAASAKSLEQLVLDDTIWEED